MKNFFILTKEDSESTRNFISSVTEFIRENGGDACTGTLLRKASLEPLKVPENTDCILTIGGDGTMIRAAMRTISAKVPILGLNKGHIGYLCDLDASNYKDAL